ncbi:MAG: XisI protein [Deltaproteobacteria bacterium]|nr:XisI protein [Deltaproteobacteria bacterium]
MDPLAQDRAVIAKLFAAWERWPRAESHFKVVPFMDEVHDRYLLLTEGWDGMRRIHNVLIHVDIIDGKFWIQRDNTEEGFATQLVAEGIPRERIVLAFYPEEVRHYGDFAVR